MVKEFYVIDKEYLDNKIQELEKLRDVAFLKFPFIHSKSKQRIWDNLDKLYDFRKMLTPLSIKFKNTD